MRVTEVCLLFSGLFLAQAASGQSDPSGLLPQPWDYVGPMRKVSTGFQGNQGVILHFGGTMIRTAQYGDWARRGAGHTEAEKQILQWMHTDGDKSRDGWYIARVELTAADSLLAQELLTGEGDHQLPPLPQILEKYQPQMIVVMVGTQDARKNTPLGDYYQAMEGIIQQSLSHQTICILSTIPPLPGHQVRSQRINNLLRQLGQFYRLPLLDFEQEILTRQPARWEGTLIIGRRQKEVGLPTFRAYLPEGRINSFSAPTREHLKYCGYLLLGWIAVQKIAEVKRSVLDDQPLRIDHRPLVRAQPRKPKQNR